MDFFRRLDYPKLTIQNSASDPGSNEVTYPVKESSINSTNMYDAIKVNFHLTKQILKAIRFSGIKIRELDYQIDNKNRSDAVFISK